MLAILIILLIAIALVLWVKIVNALYGPSSSQDEVHYVTTSDGWRLALHRYRPRGDDPHGEPVLVHHGLSGIHVNFDLGVGTEEQPVPSLSHWLADRGYDVWVCDLRGRGFSEKPKWFGNKKWDWCLDDFVEKDDPAFIDYIIEHTGFKNIHWIGLSMGGILLFCQCALHGSPKIASGVAAGSGLEYKDTGSHFEPLIPYAWLGLKLKRIPTGFLSKLEAPFLGRKNSKRGAFNFYPANIAPKAARAIAGGSLEDVSGKLMYQMSTMFNPGGLTSMDGRVRYTELAKENVTTPLLLIAGEQDLQSSTMLADKTRELFPGDQHKVLKFGRSYGHPEHYGHIDLVAGLRADQEIFPEMLAWLKAHPAERK